MYTFSSGTIDLAQLRERLGKMNDSDLLRFGSAARFMCSPQANFNEPPRESFVVQLKEARADPSLSVTIRTRRTAVHVFRVCNRIRHDPRTSPMGTEHVRVEHA
jgi:hypothetical protein